MIKMNKKILPLIIAYLENTLTPDKERILNNYIKEDIKNEELFKQCIKVYKEYRQLNLSNNINSQEVWEQMLPRFSRPYKKPSHAHLNRKNRFSRYLKFVAVILIFISTSLILKYQIAQNSLDSLIIKESNITLKLPNGEVQLIDEKTSKKITNAKGQVLGFQTGNNISYNTDLSATDSLVYNTINVPNGKSFTLILSDNTKVFLNSGTTFTYPQQFSSQHKNREVYISGEAYFEVAKNISHAFIVHTNDMDVQVLGTHFNVHSYPDEKNTNTVLLEGSVGLSIRDGLNTVKNGIILSPNEMGIFDHITKTLNKKTVISEDHIAWIKGQLIFREVYLSEIIKGLERHFNVEIKIETNKLLKEKINANFGNADLNQVLKYLKEDFGLNFKIQNDKIILK
jgi:hypothetical protein